VQAAVRVDRENGEKTRPSSLPGSPITKLALEKSQFLKWLTVSGWKAVPKPFYWWEKNSV